MIRQTLFVLFSISLYWAFAQSTCQSARYYSEVFSSTQSTTGIKFGEADPYGIISNQDLYLDIIEPVGDTLEKRPLILHQFGGGFLIGWRTEPVIPQMAEMYAKRGFVFATIDYRLGFNPLDSQSAERAVYRATQDLRAALRFLVDNADTYGIDTSAIFLTGTSAGCFAAFVNSYMNESDRSDIPSTFGIPLEPADLGCLNCSGNNNFNNEEVRVHGIINNWGAVLDTSYIDINTDPADNVPVISFHGTADNIVPYAQGSPFSLPIFPTVQGSLLIHQRLDNQGIKNRLFPLQGLGHEPQLLQLQTWVTDTIIRQGSQFVYEIMYGDSIAISGDNTVCLNDTARYLVPYNEESQYCWNVPGGTIIQQDSNWVDIVWPNIGNQLIEVQELDKREITKSTNYTVQVNTPPSAVYDYTSFDGLFEFTSSVTANTYEWDFGDGNWGTGNPVNHQYTDTGAFVVTLSITDDYCSNSRDSALTSTLCPHAAINVAQNDSLVVFEDNSNFATSYFWILEDGSVVNSTSVHLAFEQEGVYNISLIATNDFCNDTLTESYTINFCSQADFSYQSNGLQYEFQEQSFNAFFYNWNFGDGTSSALPSPSHTYVLPGVYDVQLITNSQESCSDTSTKTINVDIGSNNSYIAKEQLTLSPNPTNGMLQIIGLSSLSEISFRIISLEGKIIVAGKSENANIHLPGLPCGLYFVRLDADNFNLIEKIIIK